MATKCNVINLQKQKELEEETPLANKLKQQQQQQKDSNFSYLDLRKSTEPSVKMP